MKPLTNETLEKIGTTFAGELIGSIALGIGHTPTEIKDAIGEVELIELLEEHDKKIASALQAKEQSVKKETLDEVLKACQIANDNMVGDDPMSICSSDFEVIKKILSNLSEK